MVSRSPTVRKQLDPVRNDWRGRHRHASPESSAIRREPEQRGKDLGFFVLL
jgi:hypothetical protein